MMMIKKECSSCCDFVPLKTDKVIEDCSNCNDFIKMAKQITVTNQENKTTFSSNDELEPEDAAALRIILKELFKMEWTGWSPDIFDDGAMTYRVQELTSTFIKTWKKCYMLVDALETLNEFISSGGISLSFIVKRLVEELRGLIEPKIGLPGLKYKACKLSAWSGIRTDLHDALLQLDE